jgi:hypothetical protein
MIIEKVIAPFTYGALANFGAPPLYSTFLTDVYAKGEAIATKMASGPSDTSDAVYAEGGTHDVFYSCADNLMRLQDHADRTGNSLTLSSAGVERAIQVQIERHAGPDNSTSAWFRAADVVYKAIQEGKTVLGVAVDNDDLDEQCYGSDQNNNYTFSYLTEYGTGSIDATSPARQEFRFTGKSRPVALLAKAMIYWEKNGNARGIDPLDTGSGDQITLEWMYEGMCNHIYRWSREFLNLNSTSEPTVRDDTALFMTFLTVDAIRLCYERFTDLSEDVDQYFPTQVMKGDYKDDDVRPGFVTIPWSGTVDMIGDFMDFLYSPIDGVTLDTTAYSEDNEYTGGYLRINEEHIRNSTTYEVGDPMVWYDGSYWKTYHRSTNAGGSPNFNSNIQMMNATNLWWAASLYHGVDNARRDKYIRWGDEIFAGAVDTGFSAASDQKQHNQYMYAVFEGMEMRNALTGGNY